MKLSRFNPIIKYLEEPGVEVGTGICVPEPKMGWTLLGPLQSSREVQTINIGIIGDADSIEKTKDFFERFKTTTYGKNKSFLHIDFPGVGKFNVRIDIINTAEIEEKELKLFDNTTDIYGRVEIAADLINNKIKALTQREPTPHLLVVSYPKKIDYYCISSLVGKRKIRPQTSLEKKVNRQRSKNFQLSKFFNVESDERTAKSLDLRSLIKFFSMKHNIPIQILRPHTIEPFDPEKPKREDDATTFWNLIVAMFYKSNRLPWKGRGLPDDTVYIGVSFFRDRQDATNVKTALAQVFSVDAEGVVFKGNRAIMDSNNSPHVTKENAEIIIKKAIESYTSSKGYAPRRIVVHKTSRFNQDEIEGFKKGANEINRLDLVAFGTREIKLMRWGYHPPIRGTMMKLPDNSILLYTFGYIPYLDVYPGPRVPAPLEILEHYGNSPSEQICKEILALTKLNWNNAKFCSKSPITIAFSRRVGSILRECPSDVVPENKFRFYM